MGYVEGQDRGQSSMLPARIDEYVGDENPVRIIDAFVDSLDMEKLGFMRAVAPHLGRPPYDPRDLLKLYCYGYRHKIRSSRQLEVETHRNLEIIWLIRGLKPDFKTIADFRKNNKKALENAFLQFVESCRLWGLLGAELIAVDGTKIRASNSRKANITPKKLDKKIQYTDERINEYLEQLDLNDETEVDTPRLSKEKIQARIAELKNRRARYSELKQEMQEQGVNEISTTDPDSRRMSASNNGLDISHNVQAAVDSKHSLVVGFDVTSNPADQGSLSTMTTNAMETLGVDKIDVVADKGYYSAEGLLECEDMGATVYVPKPNIRRSKYYNQNEFHYNEAEDTFTCPAGQTLHFSRHRHKVNRIDYKNAEACGQCPLRDQCTDAKDGRTISIHEEKKTLDEIDKRTNEHKDKYRLRQIIVEHPFGTIKRTFGLTYFLVRGNEAVKAESALAFLVYNLTRALKILGFKGIMERLATG